MSPGWDLNHHWQMLWSIRDLVRQTLWLKAELREDCLGVYLHSTVYTPSSSVGSATNSCATHSPLTLEKSVSRWPRDINETDLLAFCSPSHSSFLFYLWIFLAQWSKSFYWQDCLWSDTWGRAHTTSSSLLLSPLTTVVTIVRSLVVRRADWVFTTCSFLK